MMLGPALANLLALEVSVAVASAGAAAAVPVPAAAGVSSLAVSSDPEALADPEVLSASTAFALFTQCPQCSSQVVPPVAAAVVLPFSHAVQTSFPCPELNWPLGQLCEMPRIQYAPGLQYVQSFDEVDPAAVYFPDGQTLHADDPSELYFPIGHSCLPEPETQYDPAEHSELRH